MPTYRAKIVWAGGKNGGGEFPAENEIVEGTFTSPTRFGDELGSNSGELIGTAHSGCFSVQLTAFFKDEGYVPTSLHAVANVYLDPVDGGGFEVSRIDPTLGTDVLSIDEETFDDLAQCAEENCLIPKALAGSEFTLTATLA